MGGQGPQWKESGERPPCWYGSHSVYPEPLLGLRSHPRPASLCSKPGETTAGRSHSPWVTFFYSFFFFLFSWVTFFMLFVYGVSLKLLLRYISYNINIILMCNSFFQYIHNVMQQSLICIFNLTCKLLFNFRIKINFNQLIKINFRISLSP